MSEVIGRLPRLQRRFLLSATNAKEIPLFTGMGKTIQLNFLNPAERIPDRILLYKVSSPAKDKLETLYKLLYSLDRKSVV